MGDLKELTDAQLAAIAERAEKATPGPWREGTLNVWNDAELRVVASTRSPSDPSPTTENIKTHIGQRNAAFIAATRSDVPALLDHSAALAARLAAAQATIERQQTFIKDIEWLGHSFDAGQPYLHCLICQGIKGGTGHTPLCPIPTLLAPPAPEADDAAPIVQK